jgi:hypothetical protein
LPENEQGVYSTEEEQIRRIREFDATKQVDTHASWTRGSVSSERRERRGQESGATSTSRLQPQRGDKIDSNLETLNEMRLRSDIWVAAYLRRCGAEGISAVLRRRGASDAGAIFVRIDRLDGRSALYGPAPSALVIDPERGVERTFMRMHVSEWIDDQDVEKRLAQELSFDPDIWIVEVEDREGQPRLDLAAQDPERPGPA